MSECVFVCFSAEENTQFTMKKKNREKRFVVKNEKRIKKERVFLVLSFSTLLYGLL